VRSITIDIYYLYAEFILIKLIRSQALYPIELQAHIVLI